MKASGALKEHTDDMEHRVSSAALVAGGVLKQQTDDMEQRVSSAALVAGGVLKQQTDEIESRLGTAAAEAADVLKQQASHVEIRIGSTASEAFGALKQQAEEVERRLTTTAVSASSALKQQTDGIEDRLTALSSSTTHTLKQQAEEIEHRLTTASSNASNLIRQQADDVEQRLAAASSNASSLIKRQAEESEHRLTTASSNASGVIKQQADDVEQRLTTASSNTNSLIRQQADDIEQRLTAVSSYTTGALRQQAEDIEQRLTALSSGAGAVLKQNAAEVESVLLAASAEVVRGVGNKTEEFNAAINQRIAELTNLLDDNTGTFLVAFGGRGQQFAGDVERATRQALQAIETKGLMFTKEVMGHSEELARMINNAAISASGMVGRSIEALESKAKAAAEQSQKTAASAVSEMMDTHNMLRNDTTSLFERLREANVLLQEVLGGATTNLSTIESSLSSQVKELFTTMNEIADRSGVANSKVTEQIRAFHAMTGSVLRDVTALADRFEEQGRILGTAANVMETSNRRTDDLVVERQHALEALINHLDGKTNELDQRLMRFAGLLKDSFEAAEVRARDIAQIIAKSSSEGAQAMSAQFTVVRTTAEDERKRTSEALRTVYDQATSETHALFRQASERFGQIVHDMKGMAAEIQRELETTRAEMRRGILDLPQEAAANAAELRRVIVEQIDALAELNRIVARHARGAEATEPVRRGVRDEPAAVSGSARAADSAARPARLEVVGGGRQPAPTARRPESAPAGPPPADATKDGWLSDLLARASRDDSGAAKDRPARHTIESLDALSVDIARMIDHDAAAELWDRYKRGERNVFTKRLYTMQGQKTFDEIRKRYRSDREFKLTVDRYIAEFERLLDDVSRDDRGSTVARTYLTSETGKVYTMLAHAAGRFD